MGYFKELNIKNPRYKGVFGVDVKQFQGVMKEYERQLGTDKTRAFILRSGAAAVVADVRRKPAPKSTETHFYYQRGIGGGRKIEITPGNLLKSTKKYFTKKKEYEVGPKVLKKLPQILGRTVYTSSGYYAAMVYGSAAAYRMKVLEPAVNQPNVANRIERSFAAWHKKQKAAQ
jgi:hypothetical protein